MDFVTKVTINASGRKIGYQDRILMLGSCFSDEIGRRLSEAYMDVTCNPTGTLYNPLSIVDAITNQQPIELVQHNGLWHSFRHHGDFSGPDYEATKARCEDGVRHLQQTMREATTIIVTFGTAYVYERSGAVVANCHKFNEQEFVRRRLSCDEIVQAWLPVLQQYADRHWIFTVSPIRHVRDGLHANSLSKAILLQAVERLCEATGAEYFPSYEIMMDELRDYRFYADDMCHPSGLAVDYILERFTDTYMSAQTMERMRMCRKLWQMEHHIPLHPDSAEAEAFRQKVEAYRRKIGL